jgi:tetratricopeptide (TPR) repeat protein
MHSAHSDVTLRAFRRGFWAPLLAIGAVSLALSWARAAPAQEAARKSPAAPQLVAPPHAELVRARALDWVAQRPALEAAQREEIGRLWALADGTPTAQELFDRVIETFTLADAESRAFILACQLQKPSLRSPAAKVLERESDGAFFVANMSLFYGRYLCHRRMYDEALEVLDKTALGEVVDPAGLLFFKAACQHHLLMKQEGLSTIEQLLRHTEGVPLRYATVAALMQHDLEALQDRSLDEISRKMSDVERRLQLGRTGERVQKKEEEIIATLDELIKKIEEQGGGGGGGGGQQNRSSSPSQDSTIKGATAPGLVDSKKLKNTGDWGSLPPKARARAKDLIAREFPAHYRTAIEEFTRKEASRTAGEGK